MACGWVHTLDTQESCRIPAGNAGIWWDFRSARGKSELGVRIGRFGKLGFSRECVRGRAAPPNNGDNVRPRMEDAGHRVGEKEL